MNCREAQPHLFAERDGALDNSQRAALESHVAQCAGCRHMRETLATGFAAWQAETSNVTVPDADREWFAIRRKIRGGVEAGTETTAVRRRTPWLSWITVPVGAAAALALTLLLAPEQNRADDAGPALARADFVEASDATASTMVVVDQKSGWVFVVASDAAPKQG